MDAKKEEFSKWRDETLRKYKLDKDSILQFQSTFEECNLEEKRKNGKKICEIIKCVDYEYLKEWNIERLIVNGADINYRIVNDESNDGKTALHLACQFGYLEYVCLFLRAGAEVNYINSHNISPLMLAVVHGNSEIVDVLVAMGAAIDENIITLSRYFSLKEGDVKEEIIRKLEYYQNFLNKCEISTRKTLIVPKPIKLKSSPKDKQKELENKKIDLEILDTFSQLREDILEVKSLHKVKK